MRSPGLSLPQSNQRGIETQLSQVWDGGEKSLNRTSVGLKHQLNVIQPRLVIASIEPAWD